MKSQTVIPVRGNFIVIVENSRLATKVSFHREHKSITLN
jgi:hypothetical protein